MDEEDHPQAPRKQDNLQNPDKGLVALVASAVVGFVIFLALVFMALST